MRVREKRGRSPAAFPYVCVRVCGYKVCVYGWQGAGEGRGCGARRAGVSKYGKTRGRWWGWRDRLRAAAAVAAAATHGVLEAHTGTYMRRIYARGGRLAGPARRREQVEVWVRRMCARVVVAEV